MDRKIKKQFWITEKENILLKENAKRCCLTEASYLRMLLNRNVPKEKPDIDFYEAMNQICKLMEYVEALIIQIRQTGICNEELMQEEIQRWHKFQLDIEKRFLTPEEMTWL